MPAENKLSVADLTKKLEKAVDAVMEKGESYAKKAARMEQQSENQKQKLDEALVEMNETKAQLDALKQSIAGDSGKGGEKPRPQTMGQKFAAKSGSVDYEDRTARLRMQFKSGEITNSPGSRPLGGVEDVGFKEPKDFKLRLRDLLTEIDVESDSVDFTYIESFDNQADVVAEKAKKPQSELAFANETLPTRVIAHFIKVSRQALSDNGYLQGLIDGRLRRGLVVKAEEQMILGDGTGQNLTGLVTAATSFDNQYVASVEKANKLDVLRLAMVQAILAGHSPNGMVLNPIDSTLISLTKDEAGGYLVSNPNGNTGNMSIWSLPVVESPSMSIDEFLVGDFTQAELFRRWAAAVEVGFENDDFTRNLVTILAEERLALGVVDSSGIVKGVFSTALAD